MKQFVTSVLLIGALCVGMAALTSRPVAAADDTQTLLQADHAFVQTVAKRGQDSIGCNFRLTFLMDGGRWKYPDEGAGASNSSHADAWL